MDELLIKICLAFLPGTQIIELQETTQFNNKIRTFGTNSVKHIPNCMQFNI